MHFLGTPIMISLYSLSSLTDLFIVMLLFYTHGENISHLTLILHVFQLLIVTVEQVKCSVAIDLNCDPKDISITSEVRTNNNLKLNRKKPHSGLSKYVLFWFCCSAEINLREERLCSSACLFKIPRFPMFWQYFNLYVLLKVVLGFLWFFFFIGHVKWTKWYCNHFFFRAL